MAKLYELTGDLLKIQMEIEDAEGEVTDELYQRFLDTDGNMDQKLEACFMAIKNMEASAKALKEEGSRLSKRGAAIEARVTGFKTYIGEVMNAVGKERVNGKILSGRLQRNPPSCVIEEGATIPDKFLEPQPPKVLKKELLNYLKDGGDSIDGVSVQQTTSLRIT